MQNPQKVQRLVLLFQKIDSTIIVWTTYNMQVANKLNNTLQQITHSRFDFKPFSFTQKLFKKWFDIGSQVIECEFDSDLGERKVVTYDLKKSDEFVNMYEKIKVKAMVFSLNEYKALITAREEGRIAITPDMDYEKLTSILEALLLNDIMVANV